MDPIVVGIDVSKDRLDVAVRPTGEHFAVTRDKPGLGALLTRLTPLAPRVIGLEATGGYETIVAASLAAAGLAVVVVNPAQVRAFARALGQRAKTDPIDAGVIAHFVAATKPEPRPLPDAQTRRLSDLLARRGQIIEMMVAERQRQKRLREPRIQKSIARLLAALQKELSALEADIDAAVRGSPTWRAKEALLASVSGVGKVIARTLIAELPELGQLDRRRIAALAGLAPWTRQSGQWTGQSFIGGGRSNVRAAVFLGAMTGARYNPDLKAFHDRAGGRRKAQARRTGWPIPFAAPFNTRSMGGSSGLGRWSGAFAGTVPRGARSCRWPEIRRGRANARTSGASLSRSVGEMPCIDRRCTAEDENPPQGRNRGIPFLFFIAGKLPPPAILRFIRLPWRPGAPFGPSGPPVSLSR